MLKRMGTKLVIINLTIAMVFSNAVDVLALRPKAARQAEERGTDTRRPVVFGNWKMEIQSKEDAVKLLREIAPLVQSIMGVDIGVAPSAGHLGYVAQALRELEDKGEIQKGRIKIAAQNMYAEEKGAFTSGTSAAQLKDLGISYVILGHSEVRRNAQQEETGESDNNINKKVKAALKNGLIPIVCVGESVLEKKEDRTEEIVNRMTRGSLVGLSPEEARQIVVAYEPVWAIGPTAERAATNEEAEEMNGFIRGILADMFGKTAASSIRIQYGGSVKPENIAGLIGQPNIDGALVGGASLNPDSFAQIVKVTADYVKKDSRKSPFEGPGTPHRDQGPDKPDKMVYDFGEVTDKTLVGGKGASLSEMTNLGMPVPPGFTIPTSMCIEYLKENQLPEGLWEEVLDHLDKLEKKMVKKLGDPNNPLLVSVRSGAKFSMPGMMDTILNLGLNDKAVEGLAKRTNNPRFAYDSYRRFIEGFGKIALGIEKADEKFLEIFNQVKQEENIEVSPKTDADLSAGALKNKVIPRHNDLVLKEIDQEVPADPHIQLKLAIKAVFNSWNSQRAKDYRAEHHLPDDLGTACNIQAMVFGNSGTNSGTGVYFTRNNSTGENKPYGNFLFNAQGEDVVSGKFDVLKIEQLKDTHPNLYQQLIEIGEKLERKHRDMQDIEFTIENGKLYTLQYRTGKRTGAAAIKIAVDMVKEGLITKEEAISRVSLADLLQVLNDRVDPDFKGERIAEGAAGSMGASWGRVVFDTESVLNFKEKGERVILVRIETSPEDFKGMVNSNGILTARGGDTSHAAIVCKSERKVGVFGAEKLRIDYDKKTIAVPVVDEEASKKAGKPVLKTLVLKEGDIVTIDANNKKVYLGQVPLIPGELTAEAKELLSWGDKIRRLGVRANADTPEQARKAREAGAEGIGLLRLEHWIQVNEELQTLFQLWILSDDPQIKQDSLDKIEPLLKKDMKEVLKIMEGYPVIVRTFDPPLHEFLPHDKDRIKKLTEELKVSPEALEEKITFLREANPMLGHRGVRLGITNPELTELQVRAIISAGSELVKEGVKAIPEIMIPVVALATELKHQEEIVRKTADEVMKEYGIKPEELPYKFGTMIELPAAARSAGELAEFAEFFSFGTNDLTQTTLGYSRDDTASLLDWYVSKGLLPFNPFVTLHPTVIGLMSEAVETGRGTKEGLEIGICGEHGGDPESIEISDKIGLDYVSPSGDGVLIARFVAAQAAIREKQRKEAEGKKPKAVAVDRATQLQAELIARNLVGLDTKVVRRQVANIAESDAVVAGLVQGSGEFYKDAKGVEGIVLIDAKGFLKNGGSMSGLEKIRQSEPAYEISIWAATKEDASELRARGITEFYDFPATLRTVYTLIESLRRDNRELPVILVDSGSIDDYSLERIKGLRNIERINLQEPQILDGEAKLNLMPIIFANAIARLSPEKLGERYKEFLAQNLTNLKDKGVELSEEAAEALANIFDIAITVPLATTTNEEIIRAQAVYAKQI